VARKVPEAYKPLSEKHFQSFSRFRHIQSQRGCCRKCCHLVATLLPPWRGFACCSPLQRVSVLVFRRPPWIERPGVADIPPLLIPGMQRKSRRTLWSAGEQEVLNGPIAVTSGGGIPSGAIAQLRPELSSGSTRIASSKSLSRTIS